MNSDISKFQYVYNVNLARISLLFVCILLLVGCEGDTVADASDKSAVLTWQSPAKNSDGSPISDLAGHTIYMSNTSGIYDMNDIVTNIATNSNSGGATETYTVSNLPAGTHFFQITAYNAAGFESTPSLEVQKIVR